MNPNDRIDALQEFLAEELARLQGQLAGIDGIFNYYLYERMKTHYLDLMKQL